jgi:hypothetical protein
MQPAATVHIMLATVATIRRAAYSQSDELLGGRR